MTVTNHPLTGMSDAAFYGRLPAQGVDLGCCCRAAAAQTMDGLRQIVHGHTRLGTLMIRRAVCRLSIGTGNQSNAERMIDEAVQHGRCNASPEDHAELMKAIRRAHAHQDWVHELATVDALILDLLR